jgi:hypothetical protein
MYGGALKKKPAATHKNNDQNDDASLLFSHTSLLFA